MNLKFEKKVVIVTGATSGIGEAIIRAFATENAKVVLVGRDPIRGKAIETDLASKGHEALFIAADLSNPDVCENIIAQTIQTFGGLHVLVNCAGFNDQIDLLRPPSDFVQSLYNNLVHYFAMAHYALPYLQASKGNIVNIGSKTAVTGQGGSSGYTASKGGIMALTREWATSLLKDGIRVNEVIPAEVITPMYEHWIHTFPDPEAKRHEIEQKIPLGHRFTTVDEIANTVLFLASEKSSHTTGQHVFVDGGYTHLDRAIT
jgi:L-fucose dehydrogenase